MGLTPTPALTGRATKWRGPPDRGRSVRRQVPMAKGADTMLRFGCRPKVNFAAGSGVTDPRPLKPALLGARGIRGPEDRAK